jgi:aminopeptidase-like protein
VTIAPRGADERMYAMAEELFPICRSITGDGVRDTLRVLGRRIPLDVHEVPSGAEVLDWTVPDEWNIRDAYVTGPDGVRVVDFRDSNLHVVNYSEPVRTTLPLQELRSRLHTHPDEPDWIPYRTSYYARTWGFCVSQRELDGLADGVYEVVVDSTLAPGSLTYAECVLPGQLEDEVILSTHVCHPSLANDNVSGMTLLAELGAVLAESSRRLSYRLLFLPGTIGSVAWLARNEEHLADIVAGLVVACVGDPGPLRYKRSRRGDALVDRAGAHVAAHAAEGQVLDFVPWGWDERQFNSPGFDLPVGCLTRSREGEFREYHSSADDLGLISPESLDESLRAVLAILDVLENDRRCENLSPKGEPQLGKRGLYRGMGGADPSTEQLALLWVLNQSDGTKSLLEIADRAGLSFADVNVAADALAGAELLDQGEWSLG